MITIINAAREKDTKFGEGNKHFIEINGERLLDRLIKQTTSRSEVVINARTDEYRYPKASANIITAKDFPLSGWFYGIPYWDDLTYVLLGDVYFTQEAMDTIYRTEIEDWMVFGREGANKYTLKNYGELFGVAFRRSMHSHLIKAMASAVNDYAQGRTRRCMFFHVYRKLLGLPATDEHIVQDHFTEIHDLTEDIDYPKDVLMLQHAIEKHGAA